VSLCVATVVRQRLGQHLSAATSTYIATEEQLRSSPSALSVSYERRVKNCLLLELLVLSSSPHFLLFFFQRSLLIFSYYSVVFFVSFLIVYFSLSSFSFHLIFLIRYSTSSPHTLSLLLFLMYISSLSVSYRPFSPSFFPDLHNCALRTELRAYLHHLPVDIATNVLPTSR
jgi:hypothetical protein